MRIATHVESGTHTIVATTEELAAIAEVLPEQRRYAATRHTITTAVERVKGRHEHDD